MKQLCGLAMSKSGGVYSAVEFLEPVYEANQNDAETAGILAGVYKDLFKETATTRYAQKSLETYLKNYEETGSYYTGINAATMHQIIGNGTRAKEIASILIKSLEDAPDDDVWQLATLGEAHLLAKNYDLSVKYYLLAADAAKGKYGQINSIYSQLLLLKHYIRIPAEILKQYEPPKIAAFTGHMVDHPDRVQPRFPEGVSDEVGASIRKVLEEKNIKIGYSSLACGADILFVESLLEIGGEANIYLPFSKRDFLETSVEFAGQDWVDRFEKILSNTKVNYITEESFFGDDTLYQLLGKVLIGSGIIRANLMHSKPLLFTVLSENDQAIKMGGSRSVQSIWPFGEESIININPDKFVSGTIHPEENNIEIEEIRASDREGPDSEDSDEESEIQREIRYILFADIAGFSKMQEEQTPYFMHNLLTRISRELQDYPKPRIFNTWGDSIFAVFREARFAAEYSFKLLEVFKSVDWAKENLPANIDIRIALHAGPVFVGMDPLTKKLNAYGAHINRTARMEPVTLPGTIYASEQFAATLAVESFEKYNYRHVGLVKLAKDYGYQEIYRIDEKERTALSG